MGRVTDLNDESIDYSAYLPENIERGLRPSTHEERLSTQALPKYAEHVGEERTKDTRDKGRTKGRTKAEPDELSEFVRSLDRGENTYKLAEAAGIPPDRVITKAGRILVRGEDGRSYSVVEVLLDRCGLLRRVNTETGELLRKPLRERNPLYAAMTCYLAAKGGLIDPADVDAAPLPETATDDERIVYETFLLWLGSKWAVYGFGPSTFTRPVGRTLCGLDDRRFREAWEALRDRHEIVIKVGEAGTAFTYLPRQP